jgi:hypothetical protein
MIIELDVYDIRYVEFCVKSVVVFILMMIKKKKANSKNFSS